MVFPVLVAPFPLMEMLSPETVMLVFPFSVAVALSVVDKEIVVESCENRRDGISIGEEVDVCSHRYPLLGIKNTRGS